MFLSTLISLLLV